MDRWQNKVAVVTGASSGIGAACVKDLVKAGFVVAGLARREDRIREIRDSLPANLRSRLHPVKCDVSKESDVINAFTWIEQKLGGVDVLVNNAGVLRNTNLVAPNNTEDMRAVIETNVLGVIFCTREAFKSMKARNVDGHVIIINSVAGHTIPNVPGMSLNIYPASKHAITALTESYRQEFANEGTKIKITSISPGAVDTDIVPGGFKQSVPDIPFMRSEDISDAVLYVIKTPPHVQIHEMIIRPLGERF